MWLSSIANARSGQIFSLYISKPHKEDVKYANTYFKKMPWIKSYTTASGQSHAKKYNVYSKKRASNRTSTTARNNNHINALTIRLPLM
jgi:hypothetical protein